jgi:hypothetical protein
MNSEWHYQLKIEDFRLLASNTQSFLEGKGWTSAKDAILPPEFLAPRLDHFEKMPDWLGFMVMRDEMVSVLADTKTIPPTGRSK